MPPIRVGIAGLGVAATAMLAEAAQHPNAKITAGADPRRVARDRFTSEFGGETYADIEDMVKSPNVDLVYVLTPNRMHARHAVIAADHKKQVMLDKPMGLSLEECDEVIAAAERNGVRVLVGHSQSMDPPILTMAEMVRSGELGKPLQINTWFYSDWLYRPRAKEELDPAAGEGLVMRQGPVHVDICRMLGGGIVRSVRATTSSIDSKRPIEGSYTAFMEFEDPSTGSGPSTSSGNGAVATAVYNGYGHFDSSELTWGFGLRGLQQGSDTHLKSRRQVFGFTSPEDEYAHKESTRYGSAKAGGGVISGEGERRHAFFGITVVSCEKGDLRQTPSGVFLYGDDEWREIPVPGYTRRYTTRELDLLYDAWSRDVPLTLHDARWGKATTEVCLGILLSARERREVMMAHQTPYRGAHVSIG